MSPTSYQTAPPASGEVGLQAEAPAGAVVATDSASADADRDNGTTLHDQAWCRRGHDHATPRIDPGCERRAPPPGQPPGLLSVTPVLRFVARFILDSSSMIIMVSLGGGAEQETTTRGIRHLPQAKRNQGREHRYPTPRGDRCCVILVGLISATHHRHRGRFGSGQSRL